MRYLHDNRGRICSKDEIGEAVWGESYLEDMDDQRIAKLVARLRQKVEPDPDNPQYIVTVRGRGYMSMA